MDWTGSIDPASFYLGLGIGAFVVFCTAVAGVTYFALKKRKKNLHDTLIIDQEAIEALRGHFEGLEVELSGMLLPVTDSEAVKSSLAPQPEKTEKLSETYVAKRLHALWRLMPHSQGTRYDWLVGLAKKGDKNEDPRNRWNIHVILGLMESLDEEAAWKNPERPHNSDPY